MLSNHKQYLSLIKNQCFDEQLNTRVGSNPPQANYVPGNRPWRNWDISPIQIALDLQILSVDKRFVHNDKPIIELVKSPFSVFNMGNYSKTWMSECDKSKTITMVEKDPNKRGPGVKFNYYLIAELHSSFNLIKGEEGYLSEDKGFVYGNNDPGREWYFIEKKQNGTGYIYNLYARAHKVRRPNCSNYNELGHTEVDVLTELPKNTFPVRDLPLSLATVEAAAMEVALYGSFSDSTFRQLNAREAVALITLLQRNRAIAPSFNCRLTGWGDADNDVSLLCYNSEDLLIPEAWQPDLTRATLPSSLAAFVKNASAEVVELMGTWNNNSYHRNSFTYALSVPMNKSSKFLVTDCKNQSIGPRYQKGVIIPLADDSGWLEVTDADQSAKIKNDGFELSEESSLQMTITPTLSIQKFNKNQDWNAVIKPALGKKVPPIIVKSECPCCQHKFETLHQV